MKKYQSHSVNLQRNVPRKQHKMTLITLEIACRRSSCSTGCSKITQSPEGNLARGFLPKSITTSISFLTSSCPQSSLFILTGSNSRNSSSSEADSECDVEAEFGELCGDPFPKTKRSDGFRISGASNFDDDAIPVRARRVRRNDEETVEMKLEFLRYTRVDVGTWFAECHELCRSISTRWEFKALILRIRLCFRWVSGWVIRRREAKFWKKKQEDSDGSPMGSEGGWGPRRGTTSNEAEQLF